MATLFLTFIKHSLHRHQSHRQLILGIWPKLLLQVMTIPLVLVGSNVPVGYTVPKFPSVYPIYTREFEVAYLYYTYDIWRFTLFWTLIIYVPAHLASAIFAVTMQRRFLSGLMIIGVYLVMSGIQAFVSGTIAGLMLAAIYKSGLFAMTTWIPFSWAFTITFYMIRNSYSMTSISL